MVTIVNYKNKNQVVIFLLRLGFLSFMLFLYSLRLTAQNKQAAIWYVGNKKLDFNTIPITITNVASPFLGIDGSSALADKNGDLLLFASGTSECLYDKNHQILANGDSLYFDIGLQRSIFIPIPYNDSLIYLISEKYSIIDIKNNIVITKNRTLSINNFAFDFISAVHHTNCNDIWLFYGGANKVKIYFINQDTISLYSSFSKDFASKINFTTNGKIFSYASASTTNSITISYGDFDRANANFNELYSYNFTDYELVYGSSFSSDATKLYYYMRRKHVNKYDLIQINIKAGIPDFNNFQIIATQTYTGPVPYNEMQLGLDGKIYQVFLQKNKISIINSPNKLGSICNYQDNAIPLTTAGNGLPIFISTWFSANYCELDFSSTNHCQSDNTQFTINHTTNIQSALWTFGDSQTSTILNPTYTYTNAGTYTVILTVTYTDNSSDTVTKDIEIYDKPIKPTIEHK